MKINFWLLFFFCFLGGMINMDNVKIEDDDELSDEEEDMDVIDGE